jgi:hypothetical protein
MCGEMDGEGSLADGGLGAKLAHVGAGTVVRHILGAEAASGRITEFVGVVEMASERKTVDEPFGTQGALVDVWTMCLLVEGAFEGVVGPIGTVDTGVAAAGSERLGLVHILDGSADAGE